MKGITYALAGILIGGFCGLIFAGGEMNYVKKSQRGTFSPIYSIVFAVVGGAVGLGIGILFGFIRYFLYLYKYNNLI